MLIFGHGDCYSRAWIYVLYFFQSISSVYMRVSALYAISLRTLVERELIARRKVRKGTCFVYFTIFSLIYAYLFTLQNYKLVKNNFNVEVNFVSWVHTVSHWSKLDCPFSSFD